MISSRPLFPYRWECLTPLRQLALPAAFLAIGISARDLKLQHRDEERAQRNGMSRYRCPCNLYGGRRRPYKCATVERHLRHRGRHGALRGPAEVIQFHPSCLWNPHHLRHIYKWTQRCIARLFLDISSTALSDLFVVCEQGQRVGLLG